MANDNVKQSTRSERYRQRLAHVGEPPRYVLASAFMHAVAAAQRAGETQAKLSDLIEQAIDDVASDPRYRRDAVVAVYRRAIKPSGRAPRSW